MKFAKPEILSIPPDELRRVFGTEHVPQFTAKGECVNCNDRPEVRKIALSKGHLACLGKLSHGVYCKGKNEIHLMKDLTSDLKLSNYEYVAFQQLRYFGLARPVHDAPGYWLLTHLGAEFSHGRLPVREWVKVLKNHLLEDLMGRSEKKIYVHQVKGFPEWQLPEFEIIAGDVLRIPQVSPQAKLFDLKPQTA